MPYDPAAVIAALAPWDVLFPLDNRARPAKHKRWVCVSRTDLWFLRINSDRYDACCTSLPVATHSFLEYDSFLGCGGDLIAVADAELESLLRMQRDPAKQEVIGAIDPAIRPAICAGIAASRRLSPVQKRKIAAELGCA